MIIKMIATKVIGSIVWFTVPGLSLSRKKLKYALLQAGIYSYLPQRYADKDFYNSKNIRDIIRNVLFDCYAIPLRSSGGIYLIPHAYAETIELLKVFAVNICAKIYSITTMDTEAVGNIVRAYIKSESENILTQTKSATSHGTKRVTRRIARSYVCRMRELQMLLSKYEDTSESGDILSSTLTEILYLLDGEGL